jgi:hypothetical protein|tara:strand:+ start:2645 stop:4411 length:1767 start_codon:yes stop_codon:yes gene_type:complete
MNFRSYKIFCSLIFYQLIVIFFFSCSREELTLNNPQDPLNINYVSPATGMLLLPQDDHTIKIIAFGDNSGFAAQISRKKSGSSDWVVLLDESEVADTVVHFDSYKLELNTTYSYRVRRILNGGASQAVTDSITYRFLPPSLKSVDQNSETGIVLSWEMPDQFIDDSTIKAILVSRESAGIKKDFVVDPSITTFVDSTTDPNNVTYHYTLLSESIAGIVSSRSDPHTITTSFPKIVSYEWLPLSVDQMQIKLEFEPDQLSFIRTAFIKRFRSMLSTDEEIYRISNPESVFLQLTDTLDTAELSEQIRYRLIWCGNVLCDSLEISAKTLPFRYMKYITGNPSFTLGPDYYDDVNSASEEIPILPFYADIYEVRKTKYLSPGSDYTISENDLPVSDVSWNDAVAFCNAQTAALFGNQHRAYDGQGNVDLETAGFRLPTEVEWEYMASYGGNESDKWNFPWGDNISGHYANFYESGDSYEPGPTPVGYYDGLTNTSRDASSFFGLQDLAGNMMEWCHDWYSETAYSDHSYAQISAGPISGEAKVVRGGGWQSDAVDCNSRVRKEFVPTLSHETIGFRTVVSAEPFLTYWRTQ